MNIVRIVYLKDVPRPIRSVARRMIRKRAEGRRNSLLDWKGAFHTALEQDPKVSHFLVVDSAGEVRGPVTGAEGLGPEYGSAEDEGFSAKHRARCHCGTVRYEVCADPVDAKICHCRGCQVLHGAPMRWAAILHKRDVRLIAGAEDLRFYKSELDRRERVLPCKVSCARCDTLIADEGRRMWLAFPTLFDFGTPARVPEAFRPSCHIFYGMRVIDIDDGLPKWSGHKDESKLP